MGNTYEDRIFAKECDSICNNNHLTVNVKNANAQNNEIVLFGDIGKNIVKQIIPDAVRFLGIVHESMNIDSVSLEGLNGVNVKISPEMSVEDVLEQYEKNKEINSKKSLNNYSFDEDID